MLQAFRKFNRFLVDSENFKYAAELILLALGHSIIIQNVSVPLELVTLSGTYYRNYLLMQVQDSGDITESKNKQYLSEAINHHKIFKRMDFWHTALIYQITESRENFDFHDVRYSIDQNVVKSGFVTQVSNNFLSMSMHMREFGVEPAKIVEFLKENIKKYRLPKASVSRLESYIESSFSAPLL
jgi:hypothetical protein